MTMSSPSPLPEDELCDEELPEVLAPGELLLAVLPEVDVLSDEVSDVELLPVEAEFSALFLAEEAVEVLFVFLSEVCGELFVLA